MFSIYGLRRFSARANPGDLLHRPRPCSGSPDGQDRDGAVAGCSRARTHTDGPSRPHPRRQSPAPPEALEERDLREPGRDEQAADGRPRRPVRHRLADRGGRRGFFIEQKSDRLNEQARTEPASQEAGIAFMVRAHGLEETLREMAVASQPLVVDDVTTLARIEAASTELQRMNCRVGNSGSDHAEGRPSTG